jgi:DNA-binding CsgD family transcriptional regulator/PAS domain-containing protein
VELDPTCSEIIHLAHHAASDPHLWDEVSSLLRTPLSAPLVAFVEHNFITGRGQISHAAGIDRSFRELYGARFAERNVWLHAEHRFKPGQALTGAELVPNWELVRTEFYRHWLRPQQAFHCLVGITFRCAEEIRCLIALRPLAGPAFAAEDKRKLASLLPHLRCAGELATEFAASRLEISILMDLMGALPEAIFVVDAEGRPVFLNIAAERLIARDNGLVLAHGILAANSNKETGELRRLVADAARCGDEVMDEREDEIAISGPPGNPPLVLRIAPIRHSAVDRAGRRRPVAAVFTTRPIESTETAGHLCEFYRMTPAEARLTTLIISGYSLLAAAAELHITKNTARTHMKRIYLKTEIHRQVDLIRLLGNSVAPPH